MCDTPNHHAQSVSEWGVKFTPSVVQNSYTWFQACRHYSLEIYVCAIENNLLKSAHIMYPHYASTIFHAQCTCLSVSFVLQDCEAL